jgi:DNA-binding NtrC family response regulator
MLGVAGSAGCSNGGRDLCLGIPEKMNVDPEEAERHSGVKVNNSRSEWSRLSRRMQKRIRSIHKIAMQALVNADWPGNIRELENFIERCVILTQGDELNVPHTQLKKSFRTVVSPSSSFRQAERQVIIDALRDTSGKIAGNGGAAERLGLKRTTLQNKMRRLSITRSDYSGNQWIGRPSC